MPKYLVKMNIVEARETSFIIEANNEDDVRDGLSELDFSYFEDNCDWVCTDYEPPIIEDIEKIKNKTEKGFTSLVKNKKIQKDFNASVDTLNKMEKEND